MKRLLILLCVLSGYAAGAQDTLIFRSQFEARVLTAAKNKEPVDPVSLLVAIDGDSSDYLAMVKRLGKFYESIRPKLTGTDEQTRAKTIYKEVQREFLTTYVDSANFTALARNVHNCVSGSALYAIVLRHYNIPFEIHEVPTHVYLIAWPTTHQIRFESTSPEGFFETSPKLKDAFVKNLVSHNLMTQAYVEKVGTEKAYDLYFYARDPVTIENVAGIQYINQYLNLTDKDNHASALTALKKAAILFPQERMQYFEKRTLEMLISKGGVESPDHFRYLVEFYNKYPSEHTRNMLGSQFEKMLLEVLLKKMNEKLAEKIYQDIRRRMKDSDERRLFRVIYNEKLARYYASKGKYEKALDYAAQSYEDEKESGITQGLIADLVYARAYTNGQSAAGFPQLEKAIATYPFLKDNSKIQSIYIIICAYHSGHHFFSNDEKTGKYFLGLMERQMAFAATEPDFVLPDDVVGNCYAEAGTYYARKEMYQKALDTMNIGLKYSPEHVELKERIKIVKEQIAYKKPTIH